MIKQFKYKNVTWIDLSSPTENEIAEIARDYNIHPVAASELSSPSDRSKADLYDNFIYLILNFPNHTNTLNVSERGHDAIEVDFIVGKDFLITTSYELIQPIQEFGKIFEANSILDKGKKDIHAGYLFYYIIRHLYQSLEQNLDFINHNLKKAEENIFSDNERQMVRVLAAINKKLLDFRSTLKAHHEVLNSLEAAGTEFFGPKFLYYLRSISGEYKKVWDSLENSREFFIELKQTNEAMLQIKTNESTKIFTMLAFVTFPLSLLVTIMGLRAHGTPLIDMQYGFWIISGLMLALVILMMEYFKYRKWL